MAGSFYWWNFLIVHFWSVCQKLVAVWTWVTFWVLVCSVPRLSSRAVTWCFKGRSWCPAPHSVSTFLGLFWCPVVLGFFLSLSLCIKLFVIIKELHWLYRLLWIVLAFLICEHIFPFYVYLLSLYSLVFYNFSCRCLLLSLLLFF